MGICGMESMARVVPRSAEDFRRRQGPAGDDARRSDRRADCGIARSTCMFAIALVAPVVRSHASRMGTGVRRAARRMRSAASRRTRGTRARRCSRIRGCRPAATISGVITPLHYERPISPYAVFPAMIVVWIMFSAPLVVDPRRRASCSWLRARSPSR
jgi:hypothetical protein